MVDGRQIRAARAMLGWRREELLQAAGISRSALLRMEGALADSRGSTINKVAKALPVAGIEFVTRQDGAIGWLFNLVGSIGRNFVRLIGCKLPI